MWRSACLFLFLSCVQIPAQAFSQTARVSVHVKDASLEEVFRILERETEYTFVYEDAHVQEVARLTLHYTDTPLANVLAKCLEGTGLTWSEVDRTVVIRRTAQRVAEEPEKFTVTGIVRDEKGQGMPGVTIQLKGTTIGFTTDGSGHFQFDLPKRENLALRFTFVGYKPYEVKVAADMKPLEIVMKENAEEMDEVVVTGIFNKPKESFTGAVTTVTREDIKMHYSRNLMQTLANIDPSLRIVQNNEMGSDPNTMPEIRLRGASTMLDLTDLENQISRPEYNQPLFILDGFEVDLERVMDLNENEIESINILKDASATSMYGARGANGVIVITTTSFKPGRLTVMYEGRLNLQIPDFSTYDNLMTASEKFETEKQYGVWDNLSEYYENMRQQIEADIAAGVNYNWLKEPTRTGVGQTHSLRFMGGSEAWMYGVDLSYESTVGVMKGSDRKNFNGTISLGYRTDKWNIRQSLSVGTNNNQDSPYGRFNSYVNMNRYWTPYNEEGEVVDYFYHPLATYSPIDNPMYDKKVGVWNKSRYLNLRSNTQVRYDILPGFQASVTFGVNRKNYTMDTYYPPSHKRFETQTELDQKGSFARGTREEQEWQLRGMLNYAKTFRERHMVTVGVSGELAQSESDYVNWTATGFMTDNLDHPGMSLGYPSTGKVSGSNSMTRRVSTSVSANYYFDTRYFVDASLTYNGASSFGENSRFSPYYSFGAGWLASNERFIQEHVPFINHLRMRYSVGITGNIVFSPEVAMEVFNRNTTSTYIGGICWTLSSFANSELKQQNTIKHNPGLEMELFNHRVSLTFNYYNQLTNNTLTDMSLPISHGFSTVKGNVGKIRNEGYEVYASVNVLKNDEKRFKWYIDANYTRNRNTVVKLSEGFKERIASQFKSMATATDYIKYQEGRSLDAIYGLRTVGVDPTSGQRVFLKKDGVTTTLEQNSEDLVYLGEREPKVNMTFNTRVMWGGFTLSVGFGAKCGGRQVNMTELNKGENVNLMYNLDRRVTKYAWTQLGDMARYKKPTAGSTTATYPCDAFVQKDNVFSCNNINLRYELPHKWLKSHIGLESLAIAASLSDIFYLSTIERERGTYYPFSVNPNFSISCTF